MLKLLFQIIGQYDTQAQKTFEHWTISVLLLV